MSLSLNIKPYHLYFNDIKKNVTILFLFNKIDYEFNFDIENGYCIKYNLISNTISKYNNNLLILNCNNPNKYIKQKNKTLKNIKILYNKEYNIYLHEIIKSYMKSYIIQKILKKHYTKGQDKNFIFIYNEKIFKNNNNNNNKWSFKKTFYELFDNKFYFELYYLLQDYFINFNYDINKYDKKLNKYLDNIIVKRIKRLTKYQINNLNILTIQNFKLKYNLYNNNDGRLKLKEFNKKKNKKYIINEIQYYCNEYNSYSYRFLNNIIFYSPPILINNKLIPCIEKSMNEFEYEKYKNKIYNYLLCLKYIKLNFSNNIRINIINYFISNYFKIIIKNKDINNVIYNH